MALQARREIRLTIDSTVEGLADLNILRQELKKLGVDTVDLDKKLDSLAADFDRLATQNRAIEAFRKLKTEIQSTKQTLTDNEAAIRKLNAAIATSGNATRQQAAELRRLQNEGQRTKQSYQDQQIALQRLRSELQASGLSTRNLVQGSRNVRTALASTTNAINDVGSAYRRLRADTSQPLRDPTRQFRQGLRDTQTEALSLSQVWRRFAGIVIGGAIGRQFLNAAKALDNLRFGLEQVTGSSSAAAGQIGFLADAAQRLGFNITQVARPFVQYSAAAKEAGLNSQESNRIFNAVAASMATVGSSTHDVELAMRALAQIFAKGRVSSEELRQQLGERLPGAFQIAARSIGATTEELNKMLEQGLLQAADFLPKFATELEKAFGVDLSTRVDTLAAAMGRAGDATTQLFAALADTGPAQVASAGLNIFAESVARLTDELKAGNFKGSLDEAAASTFDLLRSMGQTADEAKRLTLLLHEQAVSQDLIRESTEKLQGQYDAFVREANATRRALEQLTANFGENATGADKLRERLEFFTRAAEAAGIKLEFFFNALDTGELDEVGLRIALLRKEVEELGSTLETETATGREAIRSLVSGFDTEGLERLQKTLEMLVSDEAIAEAKVYRVLLDAVDKKLLEVAQTAPKVAKAFEDLVEAPAAFAKKVIEELSQLSTVAGDSAEVIRRAFGEKIDTAQTVAQIQALLMALEASAAAGRKLGFDTGVAVDAAKAKFRELTAEVNEKTLEALKSLGVNVSQVADIISTDTAAALNAFQLAIKEMVKSGIADTNNLRAAFTNLIDSKQTAADAEAIELAIRNAVTRAGADVAQFADLFKQLQMEAAESAAQVVKVGDELVKIGTTGAAMEMGRILEESRKAREALAKSNRQLSESTKELSAEEEKLTAQKIKDAKSTADLAARSASLSSILQNNQVAMRGLSDAALDAFNQMITGADHSSQAALTLGQRYNNVRVELDRVRNIFNSAQAAIDPFTRAMALNAERARSVESAYLRQAIAAERLIERIAGMTAQAELSSEEQRRLANLIDISGREFNLLDQQRLANLHAAIDGARQRMQGLTDDARRAIEEIEALNKSLEEQLLRERGDQEALERRRHQETLDRIAELAFADAQAARDATKRAEELHQIKLKQIREQRAEEEKSRKIERLPGTPTPVAGGKGVFIETIELHSAVVDQKTLTDFARQINRELSRLQRFVS